jgi:MoxR-like ATPase
MQQIAVNCMTAPNAIALAMQAGLVPLLMGPPGTGKTSLRTEVRRILSLDGDIVVKPSMHDTVDFTGVPYIKDGMTYFAPNGHFLPGKDAPDTGLVTLDELGDASTPVQNVMCAFTLERRIGMAVLPSGWHIYATSNRVEDRSGANRIVSKLINRVVLLNMVYLQSDFSRYAINNDLHEWTLAYTNFAPQHLNTFDPKQDGVPFATPRQWEAVSRVLKIDQRLSNESTFATVAGLIGTGVASTFRAFVNLADRMPNPLECLAHPTTTPVPDAREVQYMLVTSFIKHASGKNIANLRKYIDRLPSKELEAYLLKSLVETRLKDMTKGGPDFAKWCAEKKSMII